MLAEPTSAQALEKTVIADFNSQLAAAISTFKSNNTGVRFTVVKDIPDDF